MPDCKTCHADRRAVSQAEYDRDMARIARTINRLWACVYVLIGLVAATITCTILGMI